MGSVFRKANVDLILTNPSVLKMGCSPPTFHAEVPIDKLGLTIYGVNMGSNSPFRRLRRAFDPFATKIRRAWNQWLGFRASNSRENGGRPNKGYAAWSLFFAGFGSPVSAFSQQVFGRKQRLGYLGGFFSWTPQRCDPKCLCVSLMLAIRKSEPMAAIREWKSRSFAGKPFYSWTGGESPWVACLDVRPSKWLGTCVTQEQGKNSTFTADFSTRFTTNRRSKEGEPRRSDEGKQLSR